MSKMLTANGLWDFAAPETHAYPGPKAVEIFFAR